MKISDVIEQFLIELLSDEGAADISRNELAAYFCCAPSQINYVLHTRFTVDRGYQVESQRGGGGFIRIERLAGDKEPYLYGLLEAAKEPMSYTRILQITENLATRGIISEEERALLTAMTSDKALSAPTNIADSVRSNILREAIIHLLKR